MDFRGKKLTIGYIIQVPQLNHHTKLNGHLETEFEPEIFVSNRLQHKTSDKYQIFAASFCVRCAIPLMFVLFLLLLLLHLSTLGIQLNDWLFHLFQSKWRAIFNFYYPHWVGLKNEIYVITSIAIYNIAFKFLQLFTWFFF